MGPSGSARCRSQRKWRVELGNASVNTQRPFGGLQETASGKNGIGGAKRVDMADVANRYPQNVAGRFYVDDQCIDCDLCRETASANFTRDDDGGHTYVLKQPETPEEEALCKESMEGCPVEAIGNDGE
jgi:ferredoxin